MGTINSFSTITVCEYLAIFGDIFTLDGAPISIAWQYDLERIERQQTLESMEHEFCTEDFERSQERKLLGVAIAVTQ
jgi:hypothetical protein